MNIDETCTRGDVTIAEIKTSSCRLRGRIEEAMMEFYEQTGITQLENIRIDTYNICDLMANPIKRRAQVHFELDLA